MWLDKTVILEDCLLNIFEISSALLLTPSSLGGFLMWSLTVSTDISCIIITMGRNW